MIAVDPRPAATLSLLGSRPIDGQHVFDIYGYLLHWTDSSSLHRIWGSGFIGSGAGAWLTPSAYASCMTPYDLGLNSPRDIALVVDPRALAQLYGPGTAGPSSTSPAVWSGGAVEFYCPTAITARAIVDVIEADPCGDMHR